MSSFFHPHLCSQKGEWMKGKLVKIISECKICVGFLLLRRALTMGFFQVSEKQSSLVSWLSNWDVVFVLFLCLFLAFVLCYQLSYVLWLVLQESSISLKGLFVYYYQPNFYALDVHLKLGVKWTSLSGILSSAAGLDIADSRASQADPGFLCIIRLNIFLFFIKKSFKQNDSGRTSMINLRISPHDFNYY